MGPLRKPYLVGQRHAEALEPAGTLGLIERKRVASAVGTALILTFVESVTATRAAIISVTSFVEGVTRGRGAISVGQNLVLSVSEIAIGKPFRAVAAQWLVIQAITASFAVR